MTLSTTTNRVSFSGNDVTTVFSFPYLFFASTDLVVVLRSSDGTETTKTLTTHYTVSGAGVSSGGTVTMLTAPATGETLVIYRDAPKTQDLDLVENDPLPAEEIEERLDKLTMLCQRLSDRLDRAIILKETDSSSQQHIPLTADRASKFLAFDSSGDAIAADGTTETPVSAFMATVLDDASASAARVTLDSAQAINSATEDTSPATGDFFPSYDVSATAQKKVKISSLNTLLRTQNTAPTKQTFTSGSGTYTTPAGVLYLKVRCVGGGGGGGPSGGSGVTIGSAGGNTTFGTAFLASNGGAAGSIPAGGSGGTAAGGTATGGDINISGQTGEGKPAGAASSINGGYGGSTPLGFGGPPGIATEAGKAAVGYGGGGGGASNNSDSTGGGGGGGGGYLEKLITSPSATYAYAVGAAGGGGTAGTNGAVGGVGTAGIIIVEEFYQ